MATWKGSPNYTATRYGFKVKYVVVHWIVGTLSTADVVFSKKGGVSAHYGVENKKVHQYVKENHIAYHAGTWNANLQSIGIEHSAQPGRPASATTYATTINLIADICKRYKLNPDTAIVPHNKFVATQCPGTMDLNKIKRGVKAKLKGATVAKATKAQITALYKKHLGRKPDAGGMKTYLNTGWSATKVESAIKGSAEYKKRQQLLKAKADREAAKKRAEAAADLAEAQRKAFEDAKKREEEAREAAKSETDKLVVENNNILKQILALLKSIFNR